MKIHTDITTYYLHKSVLLTLCVYFHEKYEKMSLAIR